VHLVVAIVILAAVTCAVDQRGISEGDDDQGWRRRGGLLSSGGGGCVVELADAPQTTTASWNRRLSMADNLADVLSSSSFRPQSTTRT